MAIIQIHKHHQITLPDEIRKPLNLEEGSLLEASIDKGIILLVPKDLIDKNQTWFWTKEWQEGEREADEDIKAGRIREFDNVEDFIEELDKY